MAEGVGFREVQRVPLAWWIAAALIGAAIVTFALVVDDDVTGTDVVVVSIVPIAVLAFMAAARLDVRVEVDRVDIRWFPLWRRAIRFAEVERVAAVRYRPLAEFGGWGIRWGWRGGRAYSISGNRGVELTLTGGRRTVIGSRDPERLAAAIRHAAGRTEDLDPRTDGGR